MIEHKTVSLADQVFEHLEKDILSGTYQRGEALTETKLSTELGVSRTPIREALRRLEQEGLIEETAKGCIVVGIGEDDLKDIFMIRYKLEGLAAAAAAEKCTEQQQVDLCEALELQEFYYSRSDAEQIKHMDNRFHNVLYKIAGRSYFDTLLPLHKKVQKYRRASVENHSRAEASVAEHRRIYEAILRKNPAAAQQAMELHIHNAYQHIIGKD